ncbi:MAG TPA: glycosyltransferase [Candidatus Sulfotelmatobacter sp.]
MIEMVCTTLWQPRWSECVQSWRDTANAYLPVNVIAGQTLMHAYEQGRIESTETILGYVHDDVIIYEKGWDERVRREFEDLNVVMVGFGGALGHGHPALYSPPYQIGKLARQQFMSNMRNAEQHGQRFSEARDVSVLDGFAVFIRRSFLQECGGWPQDGSYGYFLYMEYMCCMSRRLGYNIRLVGVDCEHLGGKSSGLKQDQVFDYEGEHLRLYEQFKDVLPHRVP